MECQTPILHDNVCDNGYGPENLAMVVNVMVEPLPHDVKVLEPTVYNLSMRLCL